MEYIYKNWQKLFLIIGDYILPIPLTILMYFLWEDMTASSVYAYFILVLALVYGYLIPGIASNVFKLWRFAWSPQIVKSVFYHHGFIYSAYFLLVHYFAFFDGFTMTYMNVIRVILANFALFAILSSYNEIIMIKQGMVINSNSLTKKGKSHIEAIFSFAFFYFGLVGASFGVSALYAYNKIVIEQHTDTKSLMLYFAICMLLMTLASLPYFIVERKQVVINRSELK